MPRSNSVSLALPAELKPLMLVSYRPQQQWIQPSDSLVSSRPERTKQASNTIS